jgi:ubiquinone/menaquinone biosynthesis C-methylase UbiE
MNLTGFTITNHVYIPERLKPDSLFEKNYLELRWQEKRIYGDEEVRHLPVISSKHPHYQEWQLRQQSCRRLISYLQKKQRPFKILEVGCGNGWLSYQLSKIPGAEVTGADVNFTELQQAGRVFNAEPNLQFIYGDIQSEVFEDFKFNVIVFAASIQYFSSLSEIISSAFKLLKPHGEIHILDSHFYERGESITAKKRTEEYYNQLGFPEMTNHYFHHCISELRAFNHKILYKPFLFSGFFNRNSNPFIWVCIKNDSLLK